MQKRKNYGWALDSARKNPYNSRVAHPGVAQLVARMVRDHEAVGSNPATRTMQSVLIGSEYPVMDTLHFLFQKFIPQFVTGRSLMLRLFLFA